MNWETLIIDYYSGEISDANKAALKEQIKIDSNVQELFESYAEMFEHIAEESWEEPSPQLHDRFHKFMDSQAPVATVKPFYLRPVSMAASVILLLTCGVLLGLNMSKINPSNTQSEELTLLKSEVQTLMKNQSVSTRINAINVSYDLIKPDNEIEYLLVKTMVEDASANVRLAAVEALTKYSKSKKVREALIRSLESETDDFVKIAIIQKLIEFKERKALPSFDKLIDDEKTPLYIKDEIHIGQWELTNI